MKILRLRKAEMNAYRGRFFMQEKENRRGKNPYKLEWTRLFRRNLERHLRDGDIFFETVK